MSLFLSSLGSLLTQLPIWLVWIAGFILAVTRWQRHPKASLMLCIALMLFAGQALLNSILGVALPQLLYQQGLPMAQMGLILTLRNVVGAFISAGAWVLVLLAVFSDREAESV